MQQADRPGVEAVPVLRGRDERRPAAPHAPPPAPSTADRRRPTSRAVSRRGRRTTSPTARASVARRSTLTRTLAVDRTLILVKPDAFARGLTGEIIARFERKGLKIVALKHMTVDEAARQAALRRARRQAVLRRARRASSPPARSSRSCSRATRRSRAARQVIGATNPLEATTGSIRGDFAIAVGQNMVHGSDSRGVRPSARPRCSSPTSDPRLGARRSGGRSSSRWASPFEVRASGVEEETRGDPRRGRRGERAPQGARGRARRARARRRHRSSRSTATSSASRATRRRRASSSSASPAARTRSSAGSRSPATASVVATAVEVTAVHVPRRSTDATLDWYVGDRRVAGPRRRLRDPGRAAPRWSPGSRATTSTSSGCRSRAC